MSDLFEDYRMLVDRSTAEAYSRCPMQARLKAESNGVAGNAAATGEQGHQAISRGIAAALPAWDTLSKGDFVSMLLTEFRGSRPDVQPEVVEAFQPIAWKLAELFAEQTAGHVLRFDGGEGDHSGQLAWDFGEFRMTSELDLLLATQAKTVLREHDWKSGWGLHDIDGVRDSFQFQVHAALVLNNYPECEELEIAVWNTRKGQRLPYVSFPRTKLKQYEARILEALGTVARYENVPLAEVPCWASTEKCRICDVAARCPAVDRPFPADDAELLRKLIATERHAESIASELQARVKLNGGRPIVTPDGDCYGKFGTEKPRETWKVKPGKGASDAAQDA